MISVILKCFSRRNGPPHMRSLTLSQPVEQDSWMSYLPGVFA